jgi:two-component system chemotaxis response regulator CheB
MLLNKKIKLLIVDDSVLFRSQIQIALKGIPEIEVVGSAANGSVALEKMKTQEIDICTLDIEMPVMDGIETLKQMKALGIKTKAIMFSSITVASAEKTLEAMRIGAFDFISKPPVSDSNLSPSEKIKEVLLPKVLSLFEQPKITVPTTQITEKKESHKVIWELFYPEVLVIASSTGGPNALVDFFSQLKDPLPFPILITQHMPPIFTASLAERLGAHSGKISREAVHGEILQPNQIYVAPGNYHMSLKGDKKSPTIHLDQKEMRNYVRPCADYLFESAANIYGKNTLGIVFTGMGRDGFEGAQAIKNNKGKILIQNEDSSVVFGMPGAIYEQGLQDYEGDPLDLARKLLIISRVRRNNNVA